MKQIIVSDGQNMFDIALQCYGTAESVMQLCLDNDLILGQKLETGQILSIDEAKVQNQDTVDYFKSIEKVVNTSQVSFKKSGFSSGFNQEGFN